MSAYLYDEAIANKLKGWTKDAKVEIYGPNEVPRLFEVIADKGNDKPVTLPIITISRDRGYKIINAGTTRRPLSYSGLTIKTSGNTIESVSAIPIAIEYQIDVFAKFQKEADIIARNLVFNIVNYPAMEIEIPGAKIWDNKKQEYTPFVHTARIEFATNVIQDSSNIKERFIEGNFTRFSILVTIQDAYLWDTRKHRSAELEVRIDDLYEIYPEIDVDGSVSIEEDFIITNKNMENKN